MRRPSLALALLALTAARCASVDPDLPAPVTLSDAPAEVVFDGTVTYSELEGGAWALRDDAGERYEPTNLPASYEVEGLRVRVEADVREDLASFRMTGPIVEVLRIAPRD